MYNTYNYSLYVSQYHGVTFGTNWVIREAVCMTVFVYKPILMVQNGMMIVFRGGSEQLHSRMKSVQHVGYDNGIAVLSWLLVNFDNLR